MRYLSWTAVLLFGVSGAKAEPDMDLLALLPDVQPEWVESVELEPSWQLEATEDELYGAVWRYNYWTAQVTDVRLEFDPGEREWLAERLRFRIKGDGSGHDLILWGYHKPTDRWHRMHRVPLDFTDWRHLDMPAAGRFHRFHPSITRLAFSVDAKPGQPAERGELLLTPPVLTAPQPVAGEIASSRDILPVFTSWGGAVPWQIKQGAQLGLTTHLSPLSFPSEPGNIPHRIRRPLEAVPAMVEAGLLPGISFYHQAPLGWHEENLDWYPQYIDGRHYTRRGGAYFCVWNDEARDYFLQHMEDCMDALDEAGLLDQVQVVHLCPGEEGEVSHEWYGVTAYSPSALAAYRAYLRTLYEDDIEALNSDWMTDYESFDVIKPQPEFFPDRERAVFTDFYRLAMLRQCVALAEPVMRRLPDVRLLWMTHTVGTYPMRYYSARYPIYYSENLGALGLIHYAQLATVTGWQEPDDVAAIRAMGLVTVGEIDIPIRTVERAIETFENANRYGFDGVFIGAIEPLVTREGFTEIGEAVRAAVEEFLVPE